MGTVECSCTEESLYFSGSRCITMQKDLQTPPLEQMCLSLLLGMLRFSVRVLQSYIPKTEDSLIGGEWIRVGVWVGPPAEAMIDSSCQLL